MTSSAMYTSGSTKQKQKNRKMAFGILIPYTVLLIMTIWGLVNIVTQKVPFGFNAVVVLIWLIILNCFFIWSFYMMYNYDISLYNDYIKINYLHGLLNTKILFNEITIQFMFQSEQKNLALGLIINKRKKILINGYFHTNESIKYIYDLLKSKGITSEIRPVKKFLDFHTDPQYKLEVILSSDMPKWD